MAGRYALIKQYLSRNPVTVINSASGLIPYGRDFAVNVEGRYTGRAFYKVDPSSKKNPTEYYYSFKEGDGQGLGKYYSLGANMQVVHNFLNLMADENYVHVVSGEFVGIEKDQLFDNIFKEVLKDALFKSVLTGQGLTAPQPQIWRIKYRVAAFSAAVVAGVSAYAGSNIEGIMLFAGVTSGVGFVASFLWEQINGGWAYTPDPSEDGAMAASVQDKALTPGGIDLNDDSLRWKITGDQAQVSVNPAEIEQLRREGIGSLTPRILKVASFNDAAAMLRSLGI